MCKLVAAGKSSLSGIKSRQIQTFYGSNKLKKDDTGRTNEQIINTEMAKKSVRPHEDSSSDLR